MDAAGVEARQALDAVGVVYADWAANPLSIPFAQHAANPYPANSLQALLHPHSGPGSEAVLGAARDALLAHLFGLASSSKLPPTVHSPDNEVCPQSDHLALHCLHDVVFTSGATAALSLVADRLPWGPEDVFICHTHAHKALLGIRASAYAAGASYVSVNSEELHNLMRGACSLASLYCHRGGHRSCASQDHPELRAHDRTSDPSPTAGAEEASNICAAEGASLHRRPFVLVAFPGECNLTGAVYPVEEWSRMAHDRASSLFPGSTAVDVVTLVDAAALVAHTPLSIRSLAHVDLAALSTYKITGSPTGLGALLVRRESRAQDLLASTARVAYFAGGRGVVAVHPRSMDLYTAVDAGFEARYGSAVEEGIEGGPELADQGQAMSRRPGRVRDTLELGTPNMDAVRALPAVLTALRLRVGSMTQVHERAVYVAHTFRVELRRVFQLVDKHRRTVLKETVQGKDVPGQEIRLAKVCLHRDAPGEEISGARIRYGPIVSFSLWWGRSGKPIGCYEIAEVLRGSGVLVRAGAMCNPGACAEVLGLSSADMHANVIQGYRCGSSGSDVIGGKHTGVVRASFGWASTKSDAVAVVDTLRRELQKRASLADQQRSDNCWRQTWRPHTCGEEDSDLGLAKSTACGKVAALYVYPVKGCQGVKVDRMDAHTDAFGCITGGISWDRILAIRATQSKQVLTHGTCPLLKRVSVSLDTCYNARGTRQAPQAPYVVLRATGRRPGSSEQTITVALNEHPSQPVQAGGASIGLCNAQQPGSRKCSEWLREQVGLYDCELITAMSSTSDCAENGSETGSTAYCFANRPNTVHVVSLSSCTQVAERLGHGWTADEVAQAARANVVVEVDSTSNDVSYMKPPVWVEDGWCGKDLLVAPAHRNNVEAEYETTSPQQICRTSICRENRRKDCSACSLFSSIVPCVRCSSMNNSSGEPLRTVMKLRREQREVADAFATSLQPVNSSGAGSPPDRGMTSEQAVDERTPHCVKDTATTSVALKSPIGLATFGIIASWSQGNSVALGDCVRLCHRKTE